VNQPPRALGAREQQLDAEQQRRRDQRQRQREEDDVEAGAAAGDEELRVLAEQVEQRLSNRKAPERRQMPPREPRRANLTTSLRLDATTILRRGWMNERSPSA
jgi:hypothetical protein